MSDTQTLFNTFPVMLECISFSMAMHNLTLLKAFKYPDTRCQRYFPFPRPEVSSFKSITQTRQPTSKTMFFSELQRSFIFLNIGVPRLLLCIVKILIHFVVS